MDLDEFSDDGFDDLTDNALQELERNAIQFTQAQLQPASQHALPQQYQHQQLPSYGWEEEDDDLDNTEVTNDAGVPIGRPVIDTTLQQREASSQVRRRPIPPVPNPKWNPTINSASRAPGGIPGASVGGGPAGGAFSASQRFQAQPPQMSQFSRQGLPHTRFSASQSSQVQQSGDVVSALQQRVRALEAELNSARGEASIIRSKATKAQQEYDSQVSRLKKQNADHMAKQERIVEAAVAAEKSANTELQFLQRDMKEVSDRARRKDKDSGAGGSFATPKKASKSWGFADGFDEMDIAISPSKGQGRGKPSGAVATNVGERTPSKGKRKRPAVDSPIAALETSTDDAVMVPDVKHESKTTHFHATAAAAPAAPFEFLQLVLDHGAFHEEQPTFDTLSQYVFPSDSTDTSFASNIFAKLPLMGSPLRPMQLLVDFSEHLIALWMRCFEEQYYEPIKYLVSLICFTLDLHTVSVAPLIVPNLVPIAQSTISVLAELVRRLPENSLASNADYIFLEEHIDISRLLGLLYTSALSCSMAPSETESGGFEYTTVGFWKMISVDMIVDLLSPKQKPSHVIGVLDLLSTSVLPGSIGPLSNDAEPAIVARGLIEKVSAKVTEQPRTPLPPKQRRAVQLAALRTLISFSGSSFGALQLALHENATPRLVTCLSAAIDDLYDQPIPSSILPPLPDYLTSSPSLKISEATASADLYRIISQSVLLIHKLVTNPHTSNIVDISQKLSMSHGGSQRYLLALGRLAFAEEDLVIEAGIEGEVVEAAHELLELAVTPDEGETVSEAFGA